MYGAVGFQPSREVGRMARCIGEKAWEGVHVQRCSFSLMHERSRTLHAFEAFVRRCLFPSPLSLVQQYATGWRIICPRVIINSAPTKIISQCYKQWQSFAVNTAYSDVGSFHRVCRPPHFNSSFTFCFFSIFFNSGGVAGDRRVINLPIFFLQILLLLLLIKHDTN